VPGSQLKEIVTSQARKANDNKGSIYMVFEYMDHDLSGLQDQPGFQWTLPQVKCIMMQILRGLTHCHHHNVMHRDMKASNILMNNRGELKLADFGLSRERPEREGDRMTQRVITLWYRAPELLLGSPRYDFAVDMWSAGCIFAELLNRKPILQGKDEQEQVKLIFRRCGTPTEETWPGCTKLKWYSHFVKRDQPGHKGNLRETFGHLPPDALNLLEQMLTLDPAKRITAKKAYLHPFFHSVPWPCRPEEMPRFEASHEFVTKQRKREAQKAGLKDAARYGRQPGRPAALEAKRPRQEGQYHNGAPADYQRPPPSAGGYAPPQPPRPYPGGRPGPQAGAWQPPPPAPNPRW